VKSASTREEMEKFWKEILKKKVQQVQKLAESKTNAHRISVWSEGQSY
jgi:hypothetical protein